MFPGPVQTITKLPSPSASMEGSHWLPTRILLIRFSASVPPSGVPFQRKRCAKTPNPSVSLSPTRLPYPLHVTTKSPWGFRALPRWLMATEENIWFPVVVVLTSTSPVTGVPGRWKARAYTPQPSPSWPELDQVITKRSPERSVATLGYLWLPLVVLLTTISPASGPATGDPSALNTRAIMSSPTPFWSL